MRTLAVVTNIPTPYRVPLFRLLDARLREEGWRLHVVFGSRGNARRLWKLDRAELSFPHDFLEGRSVRLGRERIMNGYGGLSRLLRRLRPDGIVCTGYSLGTHAALRHARRRDVPLAIWSGTVEAEVEGSWPRRLQRRWLVGRSQGFLAYGSAARRYLESLGAPEERIHVAWNTVDTTRFLALEGARRPAGALRVLSVGYLEERKRVDLILRAVAAARTAGIDVRLDVVGDGSRREALQALARDLGLGEHCVFHGYCPYGRLREVYRGAHLFAFSTHRDIWGLVLVEAMAAGLPCLASVRAGATRDLVVEGETGYALDFERTGEVVGRLRAFAREPARVEEMGAASRNRIREHFTLDHSCEGWLRLVDRW